MFDGSKEFLYHLYTCLEDTSLDSDQCSYDFLRIAIHHRILNEPYGYLKYLHRDIFEMILACYEENDYHISKLKNLNAINHLCVIANEEGMFDDIAINFIESFFTIYDIEEVKANYRHQAWIAGVLSCIKYIQVNDLYQIFEEYYDQEIDDLKTLFYALVCGLIAYCELCYPDDDDAYDFFSSTLLDQLDLELSEYLYAHNHHIDPYYYYDDEFLIAYGNQQYFDLNEEARALKKFIDENANTEDILDDYFSSNDPLVKELDSDTLLNNINLNIVHNIVVAAHRYTLLEDIFSAVLPLEDDILIEEAKNIFTAFIHTLPCALHEGIAYKDVYLDDDLHPSMLLNQQDIHAFEHLVSKLAGFIHVKYLEQDHHVLFDDLDNQSIDSLLYKPYEYLMHHPEIVDDFIENNFHMSEQRRNNTLQFKNCLIDWGYVMDIDDEYVYILDQEGNVYGCKLTNPELIFLYEAKQKSGLYLPFLFVNYNEKLVALSLIINLTDYQVDSNVLKHFEEIKQKDTNYEINYLL